MKFHTFHLDMPILILILMLSFIKSVLCYTENQDTLEIDKNVEISTEKVKESKDEKPKERKIDVDDKSDVSSQEPLKYMDGWDFLKIRTEQKYQKIILITFIHLQKLYRFWKLWGCGS